MIDFPINSLISWLPLANSSKMLSAIGQLICLPLDNSSKNLSAVGQHCLPMADNFLGGKIIRGSRDGYLFDLQ